MNSLLLDDALPPLSSRSLRQLQSLPVRAREEIKRYLHGKCLNVESFVSHICTDTFREQPGSCSTNEERQDSLLAAFCGRVATEAEILHQVETVADEIGSELDTEWGEYCGELSRKRNLRINQYGRPLTAEDLINRVSGMIHTELEQAVRLSETAGQTPAICQTIGNIGKSAVMLLPLVRFRQHGLLIGVPLFFVLAGPAVWDYVLGRLDDRRGDYQTAISARIALLGNRVGAEFEREIRLRLADLHTWQERSVRQTASVMAEERVNFF